MVSIADGMEIDFDDFLVQGLQEYRHRSCRDVLLSNLEDKVYVEDWSDLVTRETVDSALTHAHGKILRLWYHVVALRCIRNTFTSISHLPAEVLLRIFRFCTPQGGNNGAHWLAFSQVCSDWRYLALADPSLWTEIDFKKPKFAELLLERSQPMPVSISTSHRIDQILLDSLPEPDSISSFDHTESGSVVTLTQDYLHGRFPLLGALRLHSGVFIHEYTLALLDAPRLQTLSLQNWVLRDWLLPPMGNLTCLSLQSSPPGHVNDLSPVGEPIFTLSKILQILTACPRLETLSLHDLIDSANGGSLSDDEDTAPPLPEVTLPHLKRFTLSDEASVLNSMLPLLCLPLCNEMTITCVVGSFRGATLPISLPPRIQELLCRSRWAPLRSATIGIGDILTLCGASASQAVDLYEPRSTSTQRTIELTLRDSHPNGMAIRDLQRLSQFLGSLGATLLRGLVSLQVDVAHNTPMNSINGQFIDSVLTDLLIVISKLPSMALVDLHAGPNFITFDSLPFALDPALTIEGHYAKRVARPEDPFPALQRLTIYGLKTTATVHGRSIIVHIATFASRRRRLGRPVGIFLKDCQLPVTSSDVCGDVSSKDLEAEMLMLKRSDV